ncbi:MAG: adenylyl-sulfate kinase [Myxococcaceae bacterium]|nr:adenylyl-sulfate kinase [Myxococcaceae bacterium]MCI0670535.1 adenylyl-sulfate kinase [Myxococcaceae bacterium]
MAHSQGFTLWLTGMSGTGKTTLANYIAARLRQVARPVEVLDERDVAESLWSGLGDTKDERNTVVRRLGFVAQLLSRNGVAALVSSVSPYKSTREENRRAIGKYLEVFVDCPTEKLIARDTTGLYKRALGGELPNFIGITEPYEPPNSPEVTVKSDSESVEDAATRIFQSLLDLGYVTSEELKTITGKRMKANPAGAAKARRAAKPAKDATGAKSRPAARAAREVKPATKKAAAKRKSR